MALVWRRGSRRWILIIVPSFCTQASEIAALQLHETTVAVSDDLLEVEDAVIPSDWADVSPNRFFDPLRRTTQYHKYSGFARLPYDVVPELVARGGVELECVAVVEAPATRAGVTDRVGNALPALPMTGARFVYGTYDSRWQAACALKCILRALKAKSLQMVILLA